MASSLILFLEPASFQGGVSLHPLWSLVRDFLFFTWGLPSPHPQSPLPPPHRFGGPLCAPLLPRRLLATPALGGHRLSASARDAGLHLTGIHTTVLAQSLPTVREL